MPAVKQVSHQFPEGEFARHGREDCPCGPSRSVQYYGPRKVNAKIVFAHNPLPKEA